MLSEISQVEKDMASSPITSWQIYGDKVDTVAEFIFLGSKITVDGECSHKIKRCLLPGRKAMTNLDSILKSWDITLPTKVHMVKTMVFSSSHAQMWKLDYKEDWAPKNWCFQIVMLEKTLESPLDSKEVKAVNPKGNQPWIFIGRTDAEAEAPIFCPPDAKSWLWKRPRCWGKLRVTGKGGNRWWDGWMASLTQWVWANSWR